MRAGTTWYSIHRWLGIGLGLWFALVGLTGSVLVFEDPIDAWLNPGLLTTADRGPWLAPDAIAARATDEYALGKVERIRLPQAQGEVYRLFIRTAPNRRVGSERIEAFFHPVTGALLGTRGAETLGLSAPHLLKTVYEFHRNVLLGNAIAGIVVAWPRKREGWRRLVWINRRGNATRILFDLHRSAGAIFFVLLVLATVTGSTLVYLNYVRDLVNVFSKVASFPTIPWVPGARDEPKPFGEIVAAVRGAYADRAITEIHGPPQRASGYLFYLRRAGDEHRLGDTIVWVHPVTAQILVERSDRTRTAGETLMHWLFPLHSGTAFGTAGMIAMSATGAMPILLVATGLWVWLRKKRGERIGRERRAARAAAAASAAGE